jgi:hypothetical protein
MVKSHESYIHFDFCIQTLNQARSILLTIKAEPKNSLLVPAFRYALIAYSKPYKKSRGIEKANHILDLSCIPEEHLALHQRIVNSRDQIHAHSDLGPYEPEIYTDPSDTSHSPGYTSNYINEIEELPNLDAIISLIEGTLLNMYAKEETLRANLAT